MTRIFILAFVALTACQTEAPPAEVHHTTTTVEGAHTPAPAPAADTRDGFALSTGSDGTSVEVKSGTSSGGVTTDGAGTAIDLKVDAKK